MDSASLTKIARMLSRSLGPNGLVAGAPFSVGDTLDDGAWSTQTCALLVGVSRGLLGMRTERGAVVLSSGQMVYVPAGAPHYETSMHGPAGGWVIALAPKAAQPLGAEPSVLQCSPLMEALAERIAGGDEKKDAPAQRRLAAVFLDELCVAAPASHLSVPLPVTLELLRVATEIMNEPADKKSLDHWAQEVGVSRRWFTERFRNECGISFVAWRQRVKVHAALKLLARGAPVSSVSKQLAFPTPSFFIQVFKKLLTLPPEKYISGEKRLLLGGTPAAHRKSRSTRSR